MANRATIDDVRLIPYFVGLDDREAGEIADRLSLRNYSEHEHVLEGGGPVAGLFFVKSGKARVYRVARDGRERTLRLLTAGDIFAEVAAFDTGPSPAWVEALEPLEVIIVPGGALMGVLEDRPMIALNILRQFAQRIRELTAQVEQMSLQTVHNRVARYFLELANEEGERCESGISVPRALTQQDLAAVVGSVREVVARSLKLMEQDEVIQMERKRVIITDIEGLRKLA
ncbi:MAG TPA: Crp/Fnr family transcriptional regulator [Dehalococcoidia bacterium]|nr:Crp/Fnr family transcriptional regulator [Dehalococcoidia bacterium]